MLIASSRRFGVLRLALLAGGALIAQAASAQSSTEEVEPVEALAEEAAESEDEIIVTGSRPIAESEAAALAVQKQSDALISVAAADSVGRLPDQNVAQATGRLPGVAVQRDQGQARYISLRGAPINWTTLSIDGIAVVSPEGRDTRYDSIPSAIASQIIVRKAVTPDMTGETVAGNIDIKTRSSFDYSGFHIAAKAGGGYVELGERQEYEGSLVLSNRFDVGGAGEIGVLLSGSYYQRDMITDNFETDFEVVSQDRQPFPDARGRLFGRETENKLYRLTRKNYSYSGRLDWEPSDGQRIFVQSIFTTFTDDEFRDNYIFDLDDRQADLNRPVGCGGITPASPVTTTAYADVCLGNSTLTGTVYGIDINQRATLRAFEQSIFTNTVGGDFEFGERTRLGVRLNYTRSKDDRSVVGEARYESPSTRSLRPTVEYDFTDPQLHKVRLFRTVQTGAVFTRGAQVTAIDEFVRPLTSLTSSDFVDITKAYTAKADLSHDLPLFGGEGTITIGARYDRRTKEANENQLSINNAQATAAGISTTFLPDSLDTPFRGEIPLGYTFRYFDPRKLRDNVEKAQAVANFAPLLGNFYNVREEVFAGYAMASTDFDWGSILGGARVEHIKNRGRAFVQFGGTFTPVETEDDFTLVYPSLHLNFDLDQTKKLRLSFNSGAARPDYDQLRPNFIFNDANQTISGGNPEARPEKAYGVDAYFEYYIQPQGYFMVGAFYKKIEDVLFASTRTFNSDVLNSGGVDRSSYTLSTIVNGGEGEIYGVEGAIQQQLEPFTEQFGLPEWMGGFGINANITLNHSDAREPDGSKTTLPGTSDVVYNIGGYYEKYGLSLRLNYQYRTDWLDSVGADVDGGDTFWATDDELDFSARYAINPNIEVYFDASNLLNGPGRRFVRDNIFTIEWERFGRRYTGGVRVNF